MTNLHVGQTGRRRLTFSAEHVQAYADLTGDRNPLHFDEEFAAATKFGKLVVQGGLTTGLIHALVSENLPGPGTVFMSQEWRFPAPVFVGDTVTATAEVVSMHSSKPVTELAVSATRSDGETVLEGVAWCYTFSPTSEG